MPEIVIPANFDGDVLIIDLPKDPSSIHVQRKEGEPRKIYSPEIQVESTEVAPTTYDLTCALADVAAVMGAIESVAKYVDTRPSQVLSLYKARLEIVLDDMRSWIADRAGE